MNIERFDETYSAFKSTDKIEIACDHPQHEGPSPTLGKQPARRNILKNGGEQFICRKCCMKYDNPMNKRGSSRQTDEVVTVICPHPEHKGDRERQMKLACYYGKMEEPYEQVCGSCAQLGKEVSEEQREKIRLSLTGIERSDEFKQKLSDHMKHNPEGVARGTKNIIENRGSGFLGKSHSEETKQKMSEAMTGRKYTEEHCQNISEGRKKMLEETGGFTREHRENISKATIRQYQNGFEPKLHHLPGWHESPKAGKVYYRSSYEKKAYMKLDEDHSVESYQTEAVSVEYWHPKKEIMSSYLIDILVQYVDGSQMLVEVKPAKWLQDEVVIAKVEMGETKADQMGIPFEVWTELELFGPVYNEKRIRQFVQKIKDKKV